MDAITSCLLLLTYIIYVHDFCQRVTISVKPAVEIKLKEVFMVYEFEEVNERWKLWAKLLADYITILIEASHKVKTVFVGVEFSMGQISLTQTWNLAPW